MPRSRAAGAHGRIGAEPALRGVGVEELAGEVGAMPRNPATLLRYLAMPGAVTEGRDGFRLTEVGALLRAGAPGSMRAPALMYGRPFYDPFAALGHTVRTGQVGFEHLFGENLEWAAVGARSDNGQGVAGEGSRPYRGRRSASAGGGRAGVRAVRGQR
ncbi:hypothetical protein [Streptomyces sp. NPDC002324]